MKKFLKILLAVIIAASSLTASAYRHDFKTTPNDPTKTLEYTLPNGLKVFMSVNKDKPRLQTYIAVRVGGKNDPAETTGLAHYFEHLMFKGTETFGTQDYAAEKPMLDQIEQLFEVYRVTSDSLTRANIYRQIDSISYQASLIAIPNEYDKLMSTIGASGTNAFTSQDVTCYVEDIPSNQIDNWARIQADRFKHPVLRGFHTELETIYEEKNMSLTNDNRKVYETMFSILFPNHPYGKQTVLGSQEHLKNPSITNVKNYHKQWYVPNNMAVVLAGDFDPDNALDIIEKYFGDMQPNPNLPVLNFPAEQEITSPIVKEVKGLEAERVYVAWRIPAAKDPDMLVINLLCEVLKNGKCGIMDLNISQPQLMLSAGTFPYALADESAFIVTGTPKEGQSLDEVRQLLLDQVSLLKQGKFDDNLLEAVVNNYNLMVQDRIESNRNRADWITDYFINGQPWSDATAELQRLPTITKQDVVDIANKYLGDNNYVVINKVQAKDDNVLKIAKPQLTPIATNRDAQSAFVSEIINTPVEPIEPHFVDFDKELTKLKAKKGQIEVLYTKNTTNDIFQLTFVYDYGTYANKLLNYAGGYLSLLGTPDMSIADINSAFYRMGCSYRVSIGGERSYIVLSGLAENMQPALQLLEKLLNNAVADQEVWDKYVDRATKAMVDAKSNQRSCFNALSNYARYDGPANNPMIDNSYTPETIKEIKPQEMLDALRELNTHVHDVIYYGPMSEKDLIKVIDKDHITAKKLTPVPQGKTYTRVQPTETTIYIAPYDAKQLYMSLFANRGENFSLENEPIRIMYNEYFGGGMNSIVFQEMRESRSLAYSAWAQMSRDSRKGRPNSYIAQIATQNDKMMDAINAFDEIINNMPESEAAFVLAKNNLDGNMRTQRVIKDDIAWYYIYTRDLGLKEWTSKAIYNGVGKASLADVIEYQKKHVKGNKYNYAILGNIEDLDIDSLRKVGNVVILSLEDIFGY